MRIERPDSAVAALQLMARIPAPVPAVTPAGMAQSAGLGAEQGSQGAYSNLLKARLARLEKLRSITETAGKFAAVVHRMSQDGSQEELAAGMAETAALSLTELLMDANGEGPPIFPPLPSPLARSRRSLAGYLRQTPESNPPPPGSTEFDAVESAADLLLSDGGILGSLKRVAEGGADPEMKDRLYRLAQEALEVSEMTHEVLVAMQARIERRPESTDLLNTSA